MSDHQPVHQHPRSTARIAGHPIHPMLVPIPIVGFLGAFVSDLIFLAGGEPGWATASNWLLGVGLGGAVLAAAAGLTDYFGEPRIRAIGDALKHMLANVVAVLLELANLLFRLGDPDFIGSGGVFISGIVALILAYSGWKGGELVFRHGVGVADHRG